jgi:hypothetical protein
MKDNLAHLVRELSEAFDKYDSGFPKEEIESRVLGDPATSEQIQGLERHFGKQLPKDYKEFLKLHNGWKRFRGPAGLLSTQDQSADWVEERLKSLSDTAKDFGDKNPFDGGTLPILFSDKLDTYLVLDPMTMEFVLYDLTQEQKRYKNFVSFLEDELAGIMELIKDQEIKPNTSAD